MHKLILVFYIPRFAQIEWRNASQTLRARCVVGGSGELVVRYGTSMVGKGDEHRCRGDERRTQKVSP